MIRRLQPELAKVPGITLFMQPVQDLTVEDRVSRTQFQYTLEDPNADELNTFAPQMLEAAEAAGAARRGQRSADAAVFAPKLVFDRDTASRLGITPSMIDQTLYDAYGQRQVSTMFTQLNQYHVVLEVKPEFQQRSVGPARSVHPLRQVRPGPLGVVAGGSASTVLFGPSSSSTSTSLAPGSSVSTGATSSASGNGIGSASSAAFSGASASSLVFPNGSQVPLSAFTHWSRPRCPSR